MHVYKCFSSCSSTYNFSSHLLVQDRLPQNGDGRAACQSIGRAENPLSRRIKLLLATAEPRALLLVMQEAIQPKLLDKLLRLRFAAPDTSVKLCKPVSENLWGPMFQELHVWGPEQKQVVQSGGARYHDVQM